MREIIFRGKIIEPCHYCGQWLEGFYGVDDGKTFIAIQQKNGLNGFFCDPLTVGQYTGLRDKNSTRIFEGDVVKSIAAWYVVEFENGGYGLRPFGKGKLIPIMGHGNFNENEVEVIGNVYDNQEILKGENLLKDINILNEITHDHSIVAVRDTFNKYPNRFLVYDDTAWGCKLFINYRDNVNNVAHITDHFSREMNIDTSELRIEYVSQLISEKISGRDNKNKVYRHNLFLMEIKNFPEYMKNDVFECNGVKYYWKSISELENDNNAMSKNSDIIRFVKDKI